MKNIKTIILVFFFNSIFTDIYGGSCFDFLVSPRAKVIKQEKNSASSPIPSGYAASFPQAGAAHLYAADQQMAELTNCMRFVPPGLVPEPESEASRAFPLLDREEAIAALEDRKLQLLLKLQKRNLT